MVLAGLGKYQMKYKIKITCKLISGVYLVETLTSDGMNFQDKSDLFAFKIERSERVVKLDYRKNRGIEVVMSDGKYFSPFCFCRAQACQCIRCLSGLTYRNDQRFVFSYYLFPVSKLAGCIYINGDFQHFF